MKKSRVLIVLILLFWNVFLKGQSKIFYEASYRIERFIEQDGVMSTEIAGILEDSKGYIWYSNTYYLLKYDGYEFKRYQLPENIGLTNSGFNFLHLAEDSLGRIIVSNFKFDLLYFNPKTEEFGDIIDTNIRNFVIDNKGIIWGGKANGISQLEWTKSGYNKKDYQSTIFTLEQKSIIDPMLSKGSSSLQKIIGVENSVVKSAAFELKKEAKVLIINVGEELYRGTADYGFIKDEHNNIIWSFDVLKSIDAGGSHRNKIQIDTLRLARGKYTLYYHSNSNHASKNWEMTPPIIPDWWGIQILSVEEPFLEQLFSSLNKTKEQSIDFSYAQPFLDKNRNVFIASREGIRKVNYKNNGKVAFEVIQDKYIGRPNGGFKTSASGNIWIPTTIKSKNGKKETALYLFSPITKKLTLMKHGLPAQVRSINKIEEDKDGNVWLGTAGGGLFRLSPPFYESTDTINSPNLLSIDIGLGEYDNDIRGLKIDKNNNLWIGSRGANLFKLELTGNEIDVVDIVVQANLTGLYQLANLFEDSQENVWITIYDNRGIVSFNKRTKELTYYKDSFFGHKIKMLIPLREDEQGNLWFGGDGYILKLDPFKKKAKKILIPNEPRGLTPFTSMDQFVFFMVEDVEEQLWISTEQGGIFKFNEEEEKFIPLVENRDYRDNDSFGAEIIRDNKQGIWIKMDQRSGKLYHITNREYVIDTIFSTDLNSFTVKTKQDKFGDIWSASLYGLFHLDVEKDSVIIYGEKEGLMSLPVNGLEFDDVGDVWIFTQLGISKLNRRTNINIPYRKLKNFSPPERSWGAIFKNKKGHLNFLTKRGFLSFHPDSIKRNNIPPTLLITDVKVSEESVLTSEDDLLNTNNTLNLSHFENDLSIDFIGIHFDDAIKQSYQYQLEGINENWVDAGTERTARFPNLPPGNYTFKVKAANADGIWSKPKFLKITILPPWWKTWGAYFIYTLSIIGLLAYWYSTLQQKIKNKEAQLAKEKAFSNKLERINTANQRFVPNDFLTILGKESIEDLHLGDQVATNMTILFSDIRDYTPLSESMTPEENFKFINTYLGRVGPIIKAHGGFISTYLGDGFMALFVNEPEHALKASIAAQKELDNYNRERKETGKRWLKTGMGLNTGELMLGVIGDEHRYESTVISDAVNTASRMEGLTKVFGAAIILSEKTLLGLNVGDTFKISPTSKPDFAYRYLGKVKVKGKDKALKIYDLYEGETVAIRELKAQTKLVFEQGISQYYNRKFGKSAECFKQVLAVNETDKAAQYYLNKSVHFIVNGVTENWSGVEEMVMK